MTIPQDPNILVSLLNMKLRDGDFETLDEVCDNIGLDTKEVIETLKNAGFEYIPAIKQFR